MGSYDRPVKANLRFLTTPEVRSHREVTSGIWHANDPCLLLLTANMETLPGKVFLDQAAFHMYEEQYSDDSGFIQDMKMIKISGWHYKLDFMLLYKNSDDTYSFELKYGKAFYEAFCRDLQMNAVKFTFINKKLGFNKSFFLLMYFTQNPRQRIHCTSDIHSSGKDYQNLKDVYEWMRNNEHEKIEVNLTFYRERFLID